MAVRNDELKAAYATIDRLQKHLFAKEMFGSDEEEDSDEGGENDEEPWFVETYEENANECIIYLTYESD
ncbi:hypothetical protein GN958_ATG01517 [Phytophthora infestans]|uniref:Uncharacterized protein n=1 Tax=Phytophthora infestans TaxID=4787 RepID=A0A8S9V6S6_PHYIN|nr:hypothetical protein GN958_ATG01517 [Phytophthora infestans]